MSLHLLLLVAGCKFASALVTLPPNDERVIYEGRFAFVAEGASQTSVASMDWPCVTVRFPMLAITEKGDVAALMDGGGNRFVVEASTPNGTLALKRVFGTDKGRLGTYSLLGNASLSAGRYNISLRKTTEAWVFPVGNQSAAHFHGLVLDGAAVVGEAPQRSTRRIEYLGDSDTAGFGIDGTDDCYARMVDYENCDEDYSALLARSLGAELHVEAWSGKGVTKNCCEDGPPMPRYWNRTLATDFSTETTWDFSQWVPDLVIVYLGSNDFANANPPDASSFRAGYAGMLQEIFSSYEARPPTVISVCGGGSPSIKDDNDKCPYVKDASDDYAKQHGTQHVKYIEIPIGVVGDNDWGCMSHRNADGQRKIAEFLEPRVKEIMGWGSGEGALIV